MKGGEQYRAQHQCRAGPAKEREQPGEDDTAKDEFLGQAVDERLDRHSPQYQEDGQPAAPQQRRLAGQRLAQRREDDAGRTENETKHDPAGGDTELSRPQPEDEENHQRQQDGLAGDHQRIGGLAGKHRVPARRG
jgi:hypothetical protein